MQSDFNTYFRHHLTAMIAEASVEPDRSELVAACQRVLKILNALTTEERADNDLLFDYARRERIAHETGESLADINSFVAQHHAFFSVFARTRRNDE